MFCALAGVVTLASLINLVIGCPLDTIDAATPTKLTITTPGLAPLRCVCSRIEQICLGLCYKLSMIAIFAVASLHSSTTNPLTICMERLRVLLIGSSG